MKKFVHVGGGKNKNKLELDRLSKILLGATNT